MEKTRMTIVAVTGIALFFLANYLCRFLLGFTGFVATLIIAAAIAAYMGFSVIRVLQRMPSPAEKSRLLWLYGGFLGALFLAFTVWLFMGEGYDSMVLATLFLHYLPYPVFAHLFLSEGVLERLPGRKSRD